MDAIVVGAGHAGLATSQRLSERGVDHVVLERGRIGESWRELRWDSFALNTPAWINRLPGETEADVLGPADGFPTHRQFVEHLAAYVGHWDLPVREGVEVARVEVRDGGLRVHLSGDPLPLDTSAVVVASGIQNVPRLPPIATELPASIEQIPALAYRAPAQLRPGAVLVVGGGQTGGQITEELVAAGRDVYWSISKVTRVPRRYRGRDILDWLVEAGFYEAPTDSIVDPAQLTATMPIISGVGRLGHTLSLQWLASQGATLLGRIQAVDGDVLGLDDSVEAAIRFGDQRSVELCAQVDGLIEASGRELPPLESDAADQQFANFGTLDPPSRLDTRAADIRTVIWATGVTGDFSYLPDGATDGHGAPVHDRGSSPVPGIEFVGLPWMTRRGSGIINGIVKDAELVAERVARRVSQGA